MPVPKQEYQQFLQEFMKPSYANMVDLNTPFCPPHGFGPLSKFHFQIPNLKCLSRHLHYANHKGEGPGRGWQARWAGERCVVIDSRCVSVCVKSECV